MTYIERIKSNLKMGVEGSEYSIIKDILSDGFSNPSEIIRLLDSNGYKILQEVSFILDK